MERRKICLCFLYSSCSCICILVPELLCSLCVSLSVISGFFALRNEEFIEMIDSFFEVVEDGSVDKKR